MPEGSTLTDTFKYSTVDGEGDATGSTLTITIEGTNDGPVATDNSNYVMEDGELIAEGNVITDDDGQGVDSDPDGDTLNVTNVVGVTSGDAGAEIQGQYGTVTINADGSYEYTLNNDLDAVQNLNQNETLQDSFTYTVSDGHGGTDTAKLEITIKGQNEPQPKLIIEKNNDNSLTGGDAGDVLAGDMGGSEHQSSVAPVDYKYVLMLDVSGSMGGHTHHSGATRLAHLKEGVQKMLESFQEQVNVNGGTVTVHFTPFGRRVRDQKTITIEQGGNIAEALDYVNGLKHYGGTNFEDAFIKTKEWLDSSESQNSGADKAHTHAVFITDGSPNHYNDTSGRIKSGSLEESKGHLLGTWPGDNVNDVQSVLDRVGLFRAVGIEMGNQGRKVLGEIDPSGNPINLTNAEQLVDTLETIANETLNLIAASYEQQPVNQQYFAQPQAAPVQYVVMAQLFKGVKGWFAFFMVCLAIDGVCSVGLFFTSLLNLGDPSAVVSVIFMPIIAVLTTVAVVHCGLGP